MRERRLRFASVLLAFLPAIGLATSAQAQPPVRTGSSPSYGPYCFPVGARGPNGERQDIARQRGIGIHGGRTGPMFPTQGCIRVSNIAIRDLYNIHQQDPITQITIR